MPDGARSLEVGGTKRGVGALDEGVAAVGVTGLATDAALVKCWRCSFSNSTLIGRASQCTWVPGALNVVALFHMRRMSFKKAARQVYLQLQRDLTHRQG